MKALLLFTMLFIISTNTYSGCNNSAGVSLTDQYRNDHNRRTNTLSLRSQNNANDRYINLIMNTSKSYGEIKLDYSELNELIDSEKVSFKKEFQDLNENIKQSRKELEILVEKTRCDICFSTELSLNGKVQCLIGEYNKYQTGEVLWNSDCRILSIRALKRSLLKLIPTLEGNEKKLAKKYYNTLDFYSGAII